MPYLYNLITIEPIYEAGPLWPPLTPPIPLNYVDLPLLIGRFGRSVRGLVIAIASISGIFVTTTFVIFVIAIVKANRFVSIIPSVSYFL